MNGTLLIKNISLCTVNNNHLQIEPTIGLEKS